MFTEDDADKIAELKQYEIPRWEDELETILGSEVDFDIEWDSTYTFSPSLEPDFPEAGDRLIDVFREACEEEATRSLLARRLHRIHFVCVPAYHGFGCAAEESTVQFRTWVYPQTDEEVMTQEDYVRLLRRAAEELYDPGPEEGDADEVVPANFPDVLARHCAEIREQYGDEALAGVRQGMGEEIATAEALDPESADGEGNTPLHVCAAYGFQEIGWCLASRGSSLTACNKAGDTPLHVAARHGQEGMALILLYAGADPRALDAAGLDAAGAARSEDEEWTAEAIERQLAEPSPDDLPNEVLYLAASEGVKPAAASSEDEGFGEMLSMMGEAMSPEVADRTGLHHAAVSGEIGRAMLDLTQGVSLDAVDAEGNTALHLAVAGGAEELFELLLKKGAATDIPNSLGRTAEDWAGWLGVSGLGAESGEAANVSDWLDLLPRLGMDESRHEIAYAGLQDGGEEAVQGLIGGLADESLIKAELSRRALGRIGAPAVATLYSAVDSAPPVARVMSVQALGEIAAAGDETPAITDFLIRTVKRSDLEDDPLPAPEAFAGASGLSVFTVSEAIRCAGCAALAEIGESASAAVEPLTALLSDPSERVRGAAIGALCGLGERGTEAVVAHATGPDAPPPDAFLGIVDQLGDAPPPPVILDVLAKVEAPQGLSSLGQKLEPWFAHGEPSPELVGLALSMLDSSDYFASKGAESALESCGPLPESVFPAVMAALKSKKPVGGLTALKKIDLGPEKVGELAPELAAILRDDDDFQVRGAVQEVLTGFGRAAAPATEVLMEILRTDHHRNSEAAATTLGAVATSPEVVTFLAETLDKQEMSTSKGAAAGLGNMGALAKDALPSLEAMKDDFFAGDLAKEAIQKIQSEL